MRPILPITAAVVLSASFLLGGSAAAASTASGCTPTSPITLSEFERLAEDSAGCDLTGVKVDTGTILPVTVPEEGFSVSSVADMPSNADGISVTVFHSSENEVAIKVGSEVYGDDAASDDFEDGAILPGPQNPSSTPGKCNVSTAYAFLTGKRFVGTYRWFYNAANSGAAGSLDRLKEAAIVVARGTNNCDVDADSAALQSYQAGGEANGYVPQIASDNDCTGNDGRNVVGWGNLDGPLGLTCVFSNSSGQVNADIKLNSTDFDWYAGSTASGCSGDRYDSGGVGVHEFGHAAGLDHAGASSYQVMKPASGKCETSMRTLGRGDFNGLLALYGR